MRASDRVLRPRAVVWLFALALACGCGREPLSRIVDAAVDRPVASPADEPDASVWDDAEDGTDDMRARDTRPRDVPVDTAPDGPCPTGFGLCPAGDAGTCTDQRTDQNCGACGLVCQRGTRCVDGACVSVCPVGTSYCLGVAGNGCVNLASSQDHCGRCGLSCGAGQVCRDATCQPACRATLAWDLPEMTPLPGTSGAVSMGDLDGDGALDVTLVNRNSLELWRSQRNGRFEPGSPGALPVLDASERVARAGLGDFNGDGRLDLLLGLYHETSPMYLGRFLLCTATAAGGFGRTGTAKLATTASTTTWAVADMNRDGRSDLVVFEEQQVSVWLGQADGSLIESDRTATPSRLYYPLLADLNGDSRTDAVAVTSDQKDLHVFLGSGQGELASAVVTTSPEGGIPLAVADADGDGMPELVANAGKSALLLQTTKDGRFVDPQPLETDAALYAAVLVDLDRDGRLDFIRSVASDELRVSYGTGGGRFGPAQRYAYAHSSAVVVNDFDGDGRYDLALYNLTPRSVLVFKGRDGDFPGARVLGEDQTVEGAVWSGTDAVAADLNEDGIPDLATFIHSTSIIEVSLGGSDKKQPTVRYPAALPDSLLAIDVDQDGHLDLVFPSRSNGTVTILLGRGDGSFDQRLSVLVGSLLDSIIGFSPPHPGRGRDLLLKRAKASIGVLTNTGRLCP